MSGGLGCGGYAALWDRVDRAGDVLRAGVFDPVRPVPLLCQHRGGAVGVLRLIAADARGLLVEARVDDAAVARAVRGGALPGFSVAYRARRVRQGAHRAIVAAELVEVSLVAVPMQPGALVDWWADEPPVSTVDQEVHAKTRGREAGALRERVLAPDRAGLDRVPVDAGAHRLFEDMNRSAKMRRWPRAGAERHGA
ncbi:HK97 family phage prohead protease [Sphingomonas sp. BK235]|uniref:HK97 family phage prohead protease n=1 Tax=Sphingomonas sp. BK235 TaxID=2512131 RepID=UPI0010D8430C|nr:HK97 family phage prohead protease [Sphingomonas sp. BK235]